MSKVVALKVESERSRAGDLSLPKSRSNRFIRDGDCWYYRTRENRSIGPYPDRGEAEKSAKVFAGFAKKLKGDNLDELIISHLEALEHHSGSSGKETLALRAGEWEVPQFRAARIYQKAGKWYFRTREGSPVGPYARHKDVEASSKLFTDFAKTIKSRFIRGLVLTMNASRKKTTIDKV